MSSTRNPQTWADLLRETPELYRLDENHVGLEIARVESVRLWTMVVLFAQAKRPAWGAR